MNTVLYITYTDMSNVSSGSMVRPKKMYQAFFDSGYDVILLSGLASKKNKKERIKNIKEIENWLNSNKPKYCYIESPSDPIMFKEDRNLIKKIHKNKIKIGYFYRDAYYKLGKEYVFSNQKVTIRNLIRYIYYKFLFWRDEQLLNKNVDIVYFPSESMTKYFNFKDMRPLPPAGEIINYNREENNSLIYVGGISEEYGISCMLEAMDIINKKQNISLNLICREQEVKNIPLQYRECEWLKIFNVSGADKLKPIYEKSKIALLPKKPSIYNDFAISVKIFEYMSYGLPIIAIDTLETRKIIEKYNMGVVVENDSQKFADAILRLYNDNVLYSELYNNVKNAIKINLWIDRIKKINEDLTSL